MAKETQVIKSYGITFINKGSGLSMNHLDNGVIEGFIMIGPTTFFRDVLKSKRLFKSITRPLTDDERLSWGHGRDGNTVKYNYIVETSFIDHIFALCKFKIVHLLYRKYFNDQDKRYEDDKKVAGIE